jgi:hypothetical protein
MLTDVHNKAAISDNLAFWDYLARDEENGGVSLNAPYNTFG